MGKRSYNALCISTIAETMRLYYLNEIMTALSVSQYFLNIESLLGNSLSCLYAVLKLVLLLKGAFIYFDS